MMKISPYYWGIGILVRHFLLILMIDVRRSDPLCMMLYIDCCYWVAIRKTEEARVSLPDNGTFLRPLQKPQLPGFFPG